MNTRTMKQRVMRLVQEESAQIGISDKSGVAYRRILSLGKDQSTIRNAVDDLYRDGELEKYYSYGRPGDSNPTEYVCINKTA